MANLAIDDNLARRIEELAHKEGLSVDNLLRSMLSNYEAQSAKHDALESFLEVSSRKPLNTAKMVQETSENRFRQKYGDSD